MTTPPSLPSLPGLSWSRHKKPRFNTRVAAHASGREVRVPLMTYPLYEFEAVYGLTSSASQFSGLGAQSLQSLMGFFLQLQGQFGTFLYSDPEDNSVAGQSIGAGDGVTCAFVLTRPLGGFTEPVGFGVDLENVYFNGVVIPNTAYSLAAPNYLVFNVPPPAGAAITADFTYAYLCRFLEDQIDFEEFMSSLWKLDSMKFRSVKTAPGALSTTPTWLPTPGGNVPITYADFVNQNYWYDGVPYASFSSWVAAQSGSFTRTYAGSYCGSNGELQSAATNAPRFDYDPRSGAGLGLLIEPSVANFLLYTQLFSNPAWTQTNLSVTGGAGVAPDGSNTACLLTESGSGSVAHEVSQTIAVSITPTANVTVYAKAGTSNYLNLAIDGGNAINWVQAVFDLSQGAITEASSPGSLSASDADIQGAFIEPAPEFGDGWYRCGLAAFFDGLPAPTAYTYRFGVAAAAHGNTYNSNGQELHVSAGKTLYLWGAQVIPAPRLPFSYVENTNTSAGVPIGGDQFWLGAAWDNAANSLTYFQEYDVRSAPIGGTIVIANGYYGSGQDSWSLQIAPAQGVQQPSGNLSGSTLADYTPGVNAMALRVDSTTVTLACNGQPTTTSAAGSARAAMTKVSPGAYEGQPPSFAMRLRKIAAWATGLSNTELQGLSAVPGLPAPAVASTAATDSHFIDFPGFCILPSGSLCVAYQRSASAAQSPRNAQIMYTTAASPAGPWSTPAAAVSNGSSSTGPYAMSLATLPGGTILGVIYFVNFASPYTSGFYSLQLVAGTEASPGVISWGTPATIDSTPFFAGSNSAGTIGGDNIGMTAPILLPNGKYMLLIYGYLSGGASNATSCAAIFSTTPATATSWGNFTIIANGSNYTTPLAFSEASGYVDPSGNIVVVMRQDNSIYPQAYPGYWSTRCPAGADPTNAANWTAPALLVFNESIGFPDVVGLPGGGLWMMSRYPRTIGSNGTNCSWVTNWNSAKAPFQQQMLAVAYPTFENDQEQWYSQSQLLSSEEALGSNVISTIGSALAVQLTASPPPYNTIYFVTSQIVGQGQSQ
jgi:hypothetical protein